MSKKIARISAKDARAQFGEIIGRVKFGREAIIITLRGKDVVRLIPVAEIVPVERVETRFVKDMIFNKPRWRGKR